MLQTVRRASLIGALAVACAWPGLAAHAIPFDSAIAINGSVSLDTAASGTSSGNASQTGSLSVTAGGALSASTFSELTVAGSNPISQGLTDIGDSLGIRFVIGGTYDVAGATAAANDPGLFGRYTISLSNSSATDTFEISLAVLLSTQSLEASGVNAFVTGEFFVNDAGLNQIVYGRHTRDTLFGDVDVALSPDSFLVTLAPGQSATFDGTLDLTGGAFAEGSYSGDFDAEISIAGVRQVGIQQVPEPGSIALLALGLAFVGVGRRR